MAHRHDPARWLDIEVKPVAAKTLLVNGVFFHAKPDGKVLRDVRPIGFKHEQTHCDLSRERVQDVYGPGNCPKVLGMWARQLIDSNRIECLGNRVQI